MEPSSESENTQSGYLYKKTRDDRWQKRWFETNGVYLTYYKSRKMEKLLAALSLPQVGEIKLGSLEEDQNNQTGLFTLELNTRIYTLKAKSDAEARDWVDRLNRLRAEGLSFSTGSEAGKAGGLGMNTNSMGSLDISASSETSSRDQGEKPQTDWVKSGKTTCFSTCC
ncbi:hypothetical protein B484DRAFT_457854 [Ochromonadaceae sp. CCMP2298]|nr:hypothetical protein B484DRAFT_457854 [Ochromonadaceae sp. CCMP2298]|mmetsp:Transcript_33064/g.72828  ORF Transcript_33064/g.72828 Transcript_33064/m.72828 type:complete len:168 (+) Transcript_33064:101-604(+)